VSSLPTPHSSLLTRLALVLIRAYQYTLSTLLPPACRFWPTCSRYGYEAIDRHGVRHGGWMTLRRLARCHPFNPGGYDPVR
jgi:uncharacterized protein